jgi:drug/metabolite transporter (DMT)-like permease
MSPSGYIWGGAGIGALGVLVIAMAQVNNDLQTTTAAIGGDPGNDTVMVLVGVALLVVAAGMLLVGCIGAGIRAGRDDRSERVGPGRQS